MEAEGKDEKLEAITQVNEAIDKFGINVFDYEVVAINNSYYNSYRRNYGSYRRNYETRKIEAFDKLYTDVVRSNNTFTSALSKYNETAESYNEEITSFPNIIISIMTGLEPGMPIVTY